MLRYRIAVIVFAFVGTCGALLTESAVCQESNCQNGGHCLYQNKYCTCPHGFSGQHCENVIDQPCQKSPCIHGTCSSLSHSPHYRCSCKHGWIGYNCGRQDPTSIKPYHCHSRTNDPGCSHYHGSCHNITVHPYFYCDCVYGYEGYQCQLHDDVCTPNPCVNGGTCHTQMSHNTPFPKCTCHNGYSGSTCQMKGETCSPNPCQNGGICRYAAHLDVRYTCDCGLEYTGLDCEHFRGCVNHKPCMNGGTCKVTGTGWGTYWYCLCTHGYTGLNCETHVR